MSTGEDASETTDGTSLMTTIVVQLAGSAQTVLNILL
jgi:hypothetical protein